MDRASGRLGSRAASRHAELVLLLPSIASFLDTASFLDFLSLFRRGSPDRRNIQSGFAGCLRLPVLRLDDSSDL